jgi:hypothetical protein
VTGERLTSDLSVLDIPGRLECAAHVLGLLDEIHGSARPGAAEERTLQEIGDSRLRLVFQVRAGPHDEGRRHHRRSGRLPDEDAQSVGEHTPLGGRFGSRVTGQREKKDEQKHEMGHGVASGRKVSRA